MLIPDQIVERVLDMYLLSNHTIKEISETLNISKSAIRRIIRDHRSPLEIRTDWEELSKEKLEQLYLGGTSIRNLSRIFKVRREEVKRKLTLFSIPIRSRQEINKLIQERVNQSYSTGRVQETISKKIKIAYKKFDIVRKTYQTKKKNNSFNTSQPEEEAYALLIEKFGEADVIRQYRSELYPFNCDFYVKSIDTHIECQFSMYHGRKPYRPEDPDDQHRLKLIKIQLDTTNSNVYKRMVRVWTETDPEKRRVAKENNLNWLEFFTLKELGNWLML